MAGAEHASERVLRLPADGVRRFLADLFMAFGAKESTARDVARGLVDADLAGTGSHGILQAPNYLRRMAAGTISCGEALSLVHESNAVAVYDAGLMLGIPAARQAMDAAVERARRFGIAAVAVRSATHFGMAGAHAERAAEAGMIGLVMCNTRPMMPAPGGAEPVVGNNPLAIAIPSADGLHLVHDTAMSAAAMGKVRVAAARGKPIPEDWALDRDGRPTVDPGAAIAGMLLPAAGAKGFGLAFVIDLLCGLLSGGSHGAGLATMFGPPDTAADCSWLLIAIDPAHFDPSATMATAVAEANDRIRGSKRQPGVERLFVPGDRKRAARKRSGDLMSVMSATLTELNLIAETANVAPIKAVDVSD